MLNPKLTIYASEKAGATPCGKSNKSSKRVSEAAKNLMGTYVLVYPWCAKDEVWFEVGGRRLQSKNVPEVQSAAPARTKQ